MKYQALWVIGLLCVSCSPTKFSEAENTPIAPSSGSAPISTQAASPIASPDSVDRSPHTASPASQTGPVTETVSDQLPETQLPETQLPEKSTETSATGPAEPQQDYASTSPIPATGQVTIRNDIRNLDGGQLIADCPTDSAPYAFAESTNYRVQICSQEYDPWQPKYYIGQAKDGSGELRITSDRPQDARQLIFQSQGYTYILYRDGARPEQMNAYLQVYTPNGQDYAEALWYFYEATGP